jgi:hypothetical protein
MDRHPSLEEFDSWLHPGPYGPWPDDPEEPLDEGQAEIVAQNAKLLLDRDAWNAKVTRFNSALLSMGERLKTKKLRDDYRIHFDRHVFADGGKDFTNYEFPCAVSFSSCRFGDGDVDFRAARFVDGDIDFSWAAFGAGALRLSHVSFGKGGFYCIRTDFGSGSVSFYRSNFGEGVRTFSEVKLRDGYFDFHLAEFGDGNFHFVSADLSDVILRFNDAKFGAGNVRLEKSKLTRGSLGFRSVHVRGRFDCIGLGAYSGDFSGLVVDDVANWAQSSFGSIPDFRDTKLDRAPEVARMKVPRPELTQDLSDGERGRRGLSKRNFVLPIAADAEDVLRLRKLKAMAIAANDHEKDGEFFAYEMMAKRGVEHTTFLQLLFNTIYWKVSFYGQSYLRPLAWLGASFATFAAVYSLMAALPVKGWDSLWFGIIYSFKNSLPFLGTLTRSVPSPEGHVSWFALQLQAIKDAQPGPDWFTVLGTGQAMLSLFFFFFLLLGLRNKFRLK